jgi:hypothetical protein
MIPLLITALRLSKWFHICTDEKSDYEFLLFDWTCTLILYYRIVTQEIFRDLS